MTPLHVAAERGGRSKIVEYLVSKADINITDHLKVKLTVVILMQVPYFRSFLSAFIGS